MICGGLDIGGTKIEARLFGPGMEPGGSRRVKTPRADAGAFFAALAAQVAWLRAQGGAGLPIGIAMSGVVQPDSGLVRAANLPIGGEHMASRLREIAGRALPVMNDAMALAFSEANGGAGGAMGASVGLVLGTGLAAGLCIDGRPAPRHGGIAVELGHCGMPARALARHGLGLWPCGCGRQGCIESYVAGPGLARLADGMGIPGGAKALADAPGAEAVLEIWADLAAEALEVLQMTLAPPVVVLGGGLSRMPGVVARLERALAPRLMAGVPPPALRLARFGDASGVRGAALLALREAEGGAVWTR
ncbi:ROK family protein [Paracoccus sp. (in: a-proteobacteria)]